MASIFISHSSRDNEQAVKVRDWLVANGWQDIFLDLDPERGIVAGQRWKEALRQAAHRCEVVLALVSPGWLTSGWCKSEVDAARLMGKKIIVALIGADKAEVPLDLTDEQWIDLVGDPAGYRRLREGLKRAGLDPSTFVLPPERRPYPGFAHFEEEDAAIFFGRDAQIVRALDRMRGLVRVGVDRMLVILGASGSGKSSFLRAGLRPRLQRDDRAWLNLPVIRPERAVISGPFGLTRALHQIMNAEAFAEEIRRRDLPRGRADIQAFVMEREDGLLAIVAALREIAQAPALSGEPTQPPTVVLSLDQGEELFNAQGHGEAGPFIEILIRTLNADPRVLALVAMRSDSFPLLQNEERLAVVSKDTFTLDMMLEGSYRAVIEGPARLVEPPLKIDPQLVDALLEDISGQDALPLLAFTLAHLHEHYAVDNEITLSGYERLGRLKGVIDTSVTEALQAGVARGELLKDADAQLALVRAAFIPHLVQVNATEQFVRRVAMIDEIPVEASPVINCFAEQRLLIRDRRRIAGQDAEIVEVAHEALLRQPPLSRLLQENREFLVWRERLGQARAAYGANERGLLIGRELRIARDWLRRRAQGDIPPSDRAFISDSLAEDDRRTAEEAERERQHQQAELDAANARALAAQERAAAARRLAQRTIAGLSLAVFLLVFAGATAYYAWEQARLARSMTQHAQEQEEIAKEQRDEALRQTAIAQAGQLAAQANMLREAGGLVDRSAILAAQAVKLLRDIGKPSLETDMALRRALARLPRRLGGFNRRGGGTPESLSEGSYVTLREAGDQVSVHKLPGGESIGCGYGEIRKRLSARGLPGYFSVAAATPSGSFCATKASKPDREWVIDLWSAAPLTHIATIPHTGGPHVRLALSTDAEFLAITDLRQSQAEVGSFRIWSRSRNADVMQQSSAEFAAFGPGGRLFAATNGLWRLPDAGQQKPSVVLAGSYKPYAGIAFSSSGRHLALRHGWGSEVEVWKLNGSLPEKLEDSGNTPPNGILLAVDDNGRFLTIRDDGGETVLWDRREGVERARLTVGGMVATFSGREAIVLAEEKNYRQYAAFAFEPMGPALAGIHSDPGDRILWLGIEGEHVRMLTASEKTMRLTSWKFGDGALASKFSVDISEPAKWAVSAHGRRVAISRPADIVIGGQDTERQEFATMAPVGAVALSARGGVVAAAVRNAVQAWNLDTNEHWLLPPTEMEILDLRLSDDGQYVVAIAIVPGVASRGGYAYQLFRWTLARGTETITVPLGAQPRPPELRCLVSNDGSNVILSNNQRLDIAAAAASPPARADIRKACAPTIIGGTLRADIVEKYLIVTQTLLDQPIARLEHPQKIELAALSTGGRYAATSDEDGTVRLWTLDASDLIAQTCARNPRPLSPEDWDKYMPPGTEADACGRTRDSAGQGIGSTLLRSPGINKPRQ
jgi:WD40 repeat protein